MRRRRWSFSFLLSSGKRAKVEKMWRAELHRALLWNRGLWLAVLMGLIGVSLRLPEYLQDLQLVQSHGLLRHPAQFNVYHGFLRVYGNGLYPLLAPLVATLPYAEALALDRATGYRRAIRLRTTRRQYLISRLTAAALTGGLAVALPPAGLFGLLHFFVPRGLPPPELARMPGDYGPFGELFERAPDAYIAFLLALGFTFGVVWSVFGLAIGAWTTRRYLPQALPAVFSFVLLTLLALLRLETWTPVAGLIPFALDRMDGIRVLVSQASIGLAGLGLLFIGEWRNRRED